MPYDGINVSWENRRINTDNVVFGEVVYQPGGTCGPRTQRDFELVTLHTGECSVTVGQTTHELTIGMIYIFVPGKREHFQFTGERETHHSWCAIRPRFLPKDLEQALRKSAFGVRSSDLFDSILTAAFKFRAPLQEESTKMLIEQLGICLFNVFLQASHELHPARSDPAIRKFLHYVEDHFGDENCLQNARQTAGVSRSALLYKFNADMHCTPSKFLWNHRIKRGIAMLSETGYTISEIAFRCGFKNPFHFSRKVKQQIGCSPKEIRRKAFGDPGSDYDS